MAPCTADVPSDVPDLKEHFLCESFVNLNKCALSKGLCLHELRRLCYSQNKRSPNIKIESCWCSYLKLANGHKSFIIIFTVLFLLFCFKIPFIDGMMKNAFGIKCILPNNYLVWEATRPVTNCNICANLSSALILSNISRAEFSKYAYSYQPIIVKKAAQHWPAMHKFNYYFFKDLFLKTEGAFESVEEECQFLNFNSDFKNLEEVFSMQRERILNDPGTQPWYIGW